MADMIRAATPITNKNIVQPMRENRSSEAAPFDIENIGKVVKANENSELLQQNNANINKDNAPQVMMDLLKDPSVTVNFIKNIIMLEEIVGIISSHNDTVTDEIEQLFTQLSISPENLESEMLNQENASTAFKGNLFDFLREFAKNHPGSDVQKAVLDMLKSVNSESTKENVLNTLSSSLEYLANALAPSKALSTRLMSLSERFSSDDTAENFSQLQKETSQLMGEIERSILFSEKLSKLTSMVRYNLSRYNESTTFVEDSARAMLELIKDPEQQSRFLQTLYDCLSGKEAETKSPSQVLNVLVKILEKQTESDELMQLKGDNIRSVIHSLLSSPSNFTPLLHYIIPIDNGENKAFGEMWINPDEESSAGADERTIHMLLVFDIENTGRFETELFVRGRQIDLSIMYPPLLEGRVGNLSSELKKCISFSDYTFSNIQTGKLERTRSLVEVFPTLPKKRTGINVRI